MNSKTDGILGKFNSFLVAAILANLASTLSMIIDSIIAGQILGPTGLAAITSLQPVNQLVFSLTVFLNTGCAMLVAYALGSGEDFKIRGHFTFSMLLNAITAVILMVIGLLFIDRIAAVTSNDPGIYADSVTYGRILISTSGLMLMMFGLNAFVRTDNAPKLVAVAVVISNIVNLVLDIVFMKYLNMGIAGAAWASVIGYVVGIGISLAHFRSPECSLVLNIGDTRRIDRKMALFVGMPLVIDTMFMFCRILFVNRMLLDAKGVCGLAIQSVTMNLLLIVNLFLGGTGQALQGIGGMTLGAGDGKSFNRMVRLSALLIGGMSVLVFAFVELFPAQIISMFNLDSDAAISAEAIHALRLFAPCMPGFGIAYVFEVTLLVRQRTVPAMVIAFIHTMTVAIVMFIITSTNTISVWHSFWAGETLALLASASVYRIATKQPPHNSPVG